MSGELVVAPVVVFAYDRPRHLQRTLEALSRNEMAPESPLYVYSDAPHNTSAENGVTQVRRYLRTVQGFKHISIIERDRNYGLADSIINGVSHVVSEFGRIIVLEDDILTSPGFLTYLNLALNRYQTEDRVMQIAGHMFPVVLDFLTEDALFLSFISSWGWGTWERAWRQFDSSASGYSKLAGDRHLRDRFDLGGHYRYFRMLESYLQGSTNSWAIRWYLSVFLQGGLTLYPRKSLVQNIGFDGTGVNCAVSNLGQQELDEEFRVTCLPGSVAVSDWSAEIIRGIPSRRFSLKSVMTRFRRLYSVS